MKILIDYNRTIFDPEKEALYPGVFAALNVLSQQNELFLVSRNEPGRKARFESLGIKNFFKSITFVINKSEDIFLSIVGKDKNVLVVGDSISDEIRIGNNLNFATVRMLKGKFSTEKPSVTNEIPTFEIRDMGELLDILKKYEK